jgi:hypothetical protein
VDGHLTGDDVIELQYRAARLPDVKHLDDSFGRAEAYSIVTALATYFLCDTSSRAESRGPHFSTCKQPHTHTHTHATIKIGTTTQNVTHTLKKRKAWSRAKPHPRHTPDIEDVVVGRVPRTAPPRGIELEAAQCGLLYP